MSYIHSRFDKDKGYHKDNIKNKFQKGFVEGMEYVLSDIVDCLEANIQCDSEIKVFENIYNEIKKQIFIEIKERLDSEIDEVNCSILDNQYCEEED